MVLVIPFIFFSGIFILEDKYVGKLPDDNKFKMWWRRNLIGVVPPDYDDY
jgi:hypothetical protein